MTNIPLARKLLAEALQLLEEAQSHMKRPAPTRRAAKHSATLTPQLIKRIRLYVRKHPKQPYSQIAPRFNVNQGRISEIMRELR